MGCRRCGRDLTPTPAGFHELPAWDTARVRAQGWVGADSVGPVCLQCLTHDESGFLLPDPRPVDPRSGRFTRDRAITAR